MALPFVLLRVDSRETRGMMRTGDMLRVLQVERWWTWSQPHHCGGSNAERQQKARVQETNARAEMQDGSGAYVQKGGGGDQHPRVGTDGLGGGVRVADNQVCVPLDLAPSPRVHEAGPGLLHLPMAHRYDASLPMLTCRSTWKATLLTSTSGHTTRPPLGSCSNIIPLASISVLVPTLRACEESATTSLDLPFGRRVPIHVGLAQTSSSGVLLRLAALRLAVAAGCMTSTLHLRRSIISSLIALYSNATLA